MAPEDAVTTARNIARRLDLPAYIYHLGNHDRYQVACMGWHELTTEQQENCIAIVAPEGALYARTDKLEA